MNIGQIVSELKKERDDLNRAIPPWKESADGDLGKLRFLRKRRLPKLPERRRGLSAAGRRRISEAMKKRWAERRSKVTPLRKSTKAA